MIRLVYASNKNGGSIVNKVGKYLKNNIDGAYKIEFHPMECEVTMKMYYQIPEDPSHTVDEIDFIISIVGYQDRVRINLTEDTDMEKTIGQIILTDEDLADLSLAKKKVLTKIHRFIEKEYDGFDFIF